MSMTNDELMLAMIRAMGWNTRSSNVYENTWKAPNGTAHVITVLHVETGWRYVWQRGVALTLSEHGPFLTLEDCMEALWADVFARVEQWYELSVAEARRIMEASTK